MSRGLNRCGLAPTHVDKLSSQGLTKVSDYYETSPIVLLSKCQLNLEEVQEINRIVAGKLAPPPMNALAIRLKQQESHHTSFPTTVTSSTNLPTTSASASVSAPSSSSSSGLGQYSRVSTGSPSLDALIGGGFSWTGITEVVGSPGMGKTQLCLGCCAAMAVQGRGVVFIDTELKFDPLRLAGLVQSRLAAIRDSTSTMALTADRVLERVQVYRPVTSLELTQLVESLESTLLTHNVGLVVIDSVAALPRKEGMNETDRETLVTHWAALLKRAADLCHCCILVTNQVVAAGASEDERRSTELFRDGIEDATGLLFRPALGVSWSHCVDTRLVLLKRSKKWQGTSVPTDNVDTGGGGAIGTGSGRVSMLVTEAQIVTQDAGSLTMSSHSTTIGSATGGVAERVLRVQRSPVLASVQAVYEITAEGVIVGVTERMLS